MNDELSIAAVGFAPDMVLQALGLLRAGGPVVAVLAVMSVVTLAIVFVKLAVSGGPA